MQENEVILKLAIYANPVLIAIVGFFLKGILTKIDNMQEEITALLIQNEGLSKRLDTAERHIEFQNTQIIDLIKKVA